VKALGLPRAEVPILHTITNVTNPRKEKKRQEKKRKERLRLSASNEKPSIIPGCPGLATQWHLCETAAQPRA